MKTKQLTIEVVDDELRISIGIDMLTRIIECSPRIQSDYGCEPVISNAKLFAHEILSELQREQEDGTTLVHIMLDSAASNLIEDGADSIEIGETDD